MNENIWEKTFWTKNEGTWKENAISYLQETLLLQSSQ